MVTRRRIASKMRVLPPKVVPMSEDEREQAITAIATMIEQWWRTNGDDSSPPTTAQPTTPS